MAFGSQSFAPLGQRPDQQGDCRPARGGRLDAVRVELASRGVVLEDFDLGPDFRTVDGILHSPDGEKTSWFKDSEGNILALGSSL